MESFGLDYQLQKTFEMEEKNEEEKKKEEEKKEDNKIRIFIGIDMLELINRVRENFEKQYGFKPHIIDITNLIAKRVNENDLFPN